MICFVGDHFSIDMYDSDKSLKSSHQFFWTHLWMPPCDPIFKRDWPIIPFATYLMTIWHEILLLKVLFTASAMCATPFCFFILSAMYKIIASFGAFLHPVFVNDSMLICLWWCFLNFLCSRRQIGFSFPQCWRWLGLINWCTNICCKFSVIEGWDQIYVDGGTKLVAMVSLVEFAMGWTMNVGGLPAM